MASCTDGFCWDSFKQLCQNIGQNVRKSVIWDLIDNQSRLADAVAPYFEGAEAVAICGRVYLNTSTCAVSGAATASTVPIGVHVGGGRVVLDGKHVCVSVNVSGTIPGCGAFLDEDLIPVAADGAFVLLEPTKVSGCTRAMRISGGSGTSSLTFFDGDNSQNAPLPASGSLLNGPIQVPYSGQYQIRQGVTLARGSDGCVSSSLIVNGVSLGEQIAQRVNAECKFGASSNVYICLNANDTVEQLVGWESGNNTIIQTAGTQVKYEGPCP